MNTTTFYSLSTGIMVASFFNYVESEIIIEAESMLHPLMTEFTGNNQQYTNAIRQKVQVIRTKIGASYLGRYLSVTLMTFTINNAFLGYQIKPITYVAGFIFLKLIPGVLTRLSPYIGHSFKNQEELLGKVLHAATLTASIAIFPTLLLNSTTLVSFTFVALTGCILYNDVFKKVF